MEKMEFKTPIYQRKAYKAYLERNKDNEEFLEKRRKKQREYYKKNREKILAKQKLFKSQDKMSMSSM
tara:strand:- start:155 stop:355 length:201 start_codon:yes stop_codon:yes gene_type:complete